MARANKSGVRGLYKSSDGAWLIDLRWTDPKTGERKRHSEKFGPGTNAATAKERARVVLNGAMSGAVDPTQAPAKAAGTLRTALDGWLTFCTSNGIRSVESRRTHAKALVRLLGAATRLDSLTPSLVETMKTKLLAEGKQPSTVNRHVATLKTFARWARIHAGMSALVAAALRDDVSLMPEAEGRTRYLSDEESATMEANLSGWLRPIAFACRFTGARLGEITGLRWGNVDRSARVVRFHRTKTDRTREVVIVDDFARILDALPVGRPDAFVFAVPSRAGRGEAPKRTEEARRRDLASKAWGAFCEKHALVDLHCHDLRHHAATAIRRAGGGLDTVAKVLGHTNIRTAARYAHIEVEDTRAFLELASKR